jgi:hypothetical protein
MSPVLSMMFSTRFVPFDSKRRSELRAVNRIVMPSGYPSVASVVPVAPGNQSMRTTVPSVDEHTMSQMPEAFLAYEGEALVCAE